MRLFYIYYVFAKNGIDKVLVSFPLLFPMRFIVYLNPWNWFKKAPLNRGVAIRQTLEELGPIFVKFGQALATRPDIIPADIQIELAKLHDQVAPFPTSEALLILELAYGRPIAEIFSFFDENVLASASISQVHAARLKTGEDVVVKILRPETKKIIQKDLNLLKSLANFAYYFWRASRRFKPKELILEFERSLLYEINLQNEAANASQLRRNFINSPLLYVPKIYWNYVRENILVLERINAIPVTDVISLKKHGINIPRLAENGIKIFFTQVFRDCFFHADMHPGNIFVSYDNLENPRYMCVDFGIMGVLSNKDKQYIAKNLLAFFNRDYRQIAQLHLESGCINPNTRLEDFESAIRSVCEPIFERPLKDISFGFLLFRLFQVAQQFNMIVQPELMLLQKTLIAVEGLGRQLYPELNLWRTAKPYLERWMREEMGIKALWRNLKSEWPSIVESLPQMPQLLYETLIAIKAEKLHNLKNNCK